MQTKENGKLGDFQNKYMFHIACNTIKQMKGFQTSTMIIKDVKDNTCNSSDDEGVNGRMESKKKKNQKKFKMLYEATRTHELLAKTFYMAKLKKESKTIFP